MACRCVNLRFLGKKRAPIKLALEKKEALLRDRERGSEKYPGRQFKNYDTFHIILMDSSVSIGRSVQIERKEESNKINDGKKE